MLLDEKNQLAVDIGGFTIHVQSTGPGQVQHLRLAIWLVEQSHVVDEGRSHAKYGKQHEVSEQHGQQGPRDRRKPAQDRDRRQDRERCHVTEVGRRGKGELHEAAERRQGEKQEKLLSLQTARPFVALLRPPHGEAAAEHRHHRDHPIRSEPRGPIANAIALRRNEIIRGQTRHGQGEKPASGSTQPSTQDEHYGNK